MSETSKTIPTEPISPELALIDPELASSARARPAATRAETPPADLESAAGGTPRFHLRPLPASSAWLTLCVVLLVGGLFVLPTGRWLDAADIHIRYLRTSWPAVLSGADHGSRLKSADGSETAKKAEVRLAALQPHAFGWVSVPKATYYRVRFYRDG